jgi:tripartite ATP-independent transporter DctM subunit
MPPSVVLIIFGLITEQPIGPLFLAALFPSLLLSALFACVIIGWCKLNPSLGPKSEKYPLKEVLASFKGALAPLVIFVIVIAGLMYGFFTPTEAGSVGAVSVILLGLLKKQLTWKLFKKSVIESLRTSCMVLMLIAGSVVLGRWLSITNTPQIMSDWIGQLSIDRSLVMILICIVYLVGGSFIDDLAFLILATPVFFPTIVKLGYDPKWVAVVLCLTIMIGSVIPPVAMCVFIVKNITKVPMSIIYKGVYPFLLSLVFCAALVFLFPQIVLFLPAHFAAK